MSAAFDCAIAVVLAYEGGYTDDPGDPGNWTGGAVGVGTLEGTNYGISAAAYPTLDIPNLTEAAAEGIYQRDYWVPIQGDQMPLALALVTLDGAVNSGVSQSAKWLQIVLGVTVDGDIGPETLGAVSAWPGALATLCSETLAERLCSLAQDADFSTFGLGWSRRVIALGFQAAALL